MSIRTVSDQENVKLEEDVLQVLGPSADGGSVYVVAAGGYVHLAGAVEHPEEKSRIGFQVEKIPGVRMVTNHLRVRLSGQTTQTAHF